MDEEKKEVEKKPKKRRAKIFKREVIDGFKYQGIIYKPGDVFKTKNFRTLKQLINIQKIKK
jgi:hypothetical protein